MVKMEFDQSVTFTAGGFKDRKDNPAAIEAGTAVWSFVGEDAEGNDASDFVEVIVNPENELEATVVSGDLEVVGTLTFRADGDPDADEEAMITAVATIVVDAPNAVVVELTNSEPVDVVEEPTPEPPVEEPVVE